MDLPLEDRVKDMMMTLRDDKEVLGLWVTKADCARILKALALESSPDYSAGFFEGQRRERAHDRHERNQGRR